MLKQIYGLKGAPRAWRRKIHQVFAKWTSRQQLHAEPGFYCVRDSNQSSSSSGRSSSDAVARAKERHEEQQEFGNVRSLSAQQCEPGKCKCLLSAREGDIKGIATRQVADSPLAHLNDKVRQRKADYGSSLRTGFSMSILPGLYIRINMFMPPALRP